MFLYFWNAKCFDKINAGIKITKLKNLKKNDFTYNLEEKISQHSRYKNFYPTQSI